MVYMQNHLIRNRYFLGVLLLFLIFPLVTDAYTSTRQTAIQIDDHRALFLIEFGFGTRFNDFYIPIKAVRGESYGGETDVLGYDVIVDRAGTTTIGSTRSMVLSNLEIVDNQFYRIPAGSNGYFTLITEVTVPAGIPDSEYLIQVTSLPHYVGEDRDRRTVNKIELRSFISPGVELNLP